MSCVVKEEMIEWWGPIILEYYGATEGHGLTACDTAEWLTHRGTVGRVVAGELHVLDEAMQPVAKCGKIRYEISETPQSIYACHCRDCQRLTSSAFLNGYRGTGGG
jgi:acyl-CoA synthetase (AMP-forming)/AMP-acid ligase II